MFGKKTKVANTQKMHVKTGDQVIVVSGKYANGDKPVIGKVIEVSKKEGKIIVEGVHIITKGGSQGKSDAINKCITYLKQKLFVGKESSLILNS